MRHTLLALALLAGSARLSVSAVPACLENCDLTPQQPFDCCERQGGSTSCLFQRCSAYLRCREEQAAALEADVADKCHATTPGRCTVLHGCVARQEANYRKQVKRVCVPAFRDIQCGDACDVRGNRARRDVDLVCSGCVSVPRVTVTTIAATTTTTSTTSSGATTTTKTTLPGSEVPGPDPNDRCQRECLGGLGSLSGCYASCKSNCNGDRRARKICRAGCRNSVCPSIKSHCTVRVNTDGDEVTTPENEEYQACCHPRDTCKEPDEAPCEPTTTTTSTTGSPTTTAVTATSTTSTTTSPQPA